MAEYPLPLRTNQVRALRDVGAAKTVHLPQDIENFVSVGDRFWIQEPFYWSYAEIIPEHDRPLAIHRSTIPETLATKRGVGPWQDPRAMPREESMMTLEVVDIDEAGPVVRILPTNIDKLSELGG